MCSLRYDMDLDRSNGSTAKGVCQRNRDCAGKPVRISEELCVIFLLMPVLLFGATTASCRFLRGETTKLASLRKFSKKYHQPIDT